MPTSKKLWLGFGTLTLLLVLSCVLILLHLRTIDGLIHKQSTISIPISAVTRQITVNVIGYALAVRNYLQLGDQNLLQESREKAAAVDRHFGQYQQLMATDRERELAAGFTRLWRELKIGGQNLLQRGTGAVNETEVRRFYEQRVELEKFLEDKMLAAAVASYDATSRETLQELDLVVRIAWLLLMAGALIGTATGIVVGKGVIQAEQSLRRARDQLEERVQERTAELAASNAALRRSNQDLEQFASVASHDLQEPLRKIQAFGTRLQAKYGEVLADPGREYLDRMLTSAERMRNLIDDLLSFSRVRTKARPFVPVDLNEIAREAVTDLESRVEQSRGTVEVGDLPTVNADPLQMRQLLQNLIANGIKFHRVGVPPTVRVSGRVLASYNQNGDGPAPTGCEITVEDNGIGFEEIYLDRIFEVFQRLHGRDAYEGTGMGLAICRKIVERHQGQITATSKPGQGSTFVVTLQVKPTFEESKP